MMSDTRFDLKRLINAVYNYVDGFDSKFELEEFAKELDKKYFPKSYAGDYDLASYLANKRKEKSSEPSN